MTVGVDITRVTDGLDQAASGGYRRMESDCRTHKSKHFASAQKTFFFFFCRRAQKKEIEEKDTKLVEGDGIGG